MPLKTDTPSTLRRRLLASAAALPAVLGAQSALATNGGAHHGTANHGGHPGHAHPGHGVMACPACRWAMRRRGTRKSRSSTRCTRQPRPRAAG